MIFAILNVLQLIGGIMLSVGYIPQIIKSYKTKSVDDFHPKYYMVLTTGIILMELYAIGLLFQGVYMFFVTNTIALALTSTMWTLSVIYRTEK